jgi:hypothetical protein
MGFSGVFLGVTFSGFLPHHGRGLAGPFVALSEGLTGETFFGAGFSGALGSAASAPKEARRRRMNGKRMVTP